MQAAAAAASAAEAGGAASGAGGGVSSQRYSLSQAGREGRPGTPPRAVEETRHAGDKVTPRGAEDSPCLLGLKAP